MYSISHLPAVASLLQIFFDIVQTAPFLELFKRHPFSTSVDSSALVYSAVIL